MSRFLLSGDIIELMQFELQPNEVFVISGKAIDPRFT